MSIIDDVRIHQDWTEDGYEFEDLSKSKITLVEALKVEFLSSDEIIRQIWENDRLLAYIPLKSAPEAGVYQIDIPAEALKSDRITVHFRMEMTNEDRNL